MYEELVKRLRCQRFGNCPNCPMWYTEEVEPNLWSERCAAIDAADAIEELSNIREEQKAQIILMAAEIEDLKTYAELYQSLTDKSQQTVRNLLDAYPKWIPVTERLPEEMDRSCGGWSAEIRPSDDVLVWLSSEKRQSVAWYSHTYNEWTTVDENTVYCFGEVTHWMPLQQPPKEE